MDAERHRLAADARREENWKRWGPYLSERQWGTVREDYSADGSSWQYFLHEHARSRAYRWGEDGLLGLTDRECRLCFAPALWNGRDPILKERLFGLTNAEGNHGEDVKECYFYLDSTPTHSYMKALYKYPQREFPYGLLVEENQRRGRQERELELADTGIFDGDAYFDVFVEYAKAAPDDILIQLRVVNRAPQAATLHLLPTLWFRNTWSWGREGEGYWKRPSIRRDGARIEAVHETLGRFHLELEPTKAATLLFTENETNAERLFGLASATPYAKDAFHDRVVSGRTDATNPAEIGTKAAFWHVADIEAGGERTLRLRLAEAKVSGAVASFGPEFDATLAARRQEADAFYAGLGGTAGDAQRVSRQAYAGLLWSKQFYYYVVRDWLEGDPAQPKPPEPRQRGRNADWGHLFNRDVISMPDKWEYPWYAAWDTAFHMIPFAALDSTFAKEQVILLLREWYMHPNGQMPAYEFALGDVNPPVHAWAAWQIYVAEEPGRRDRTFLERVFQKLLINFTWWVNRKDRHGRHVFAAGFLGMDNIGVFDRNHPPGGAELQQADGTAWMAFYCATMLSMAVELAVLNPVYEDVASKFFEHFVAIADAMNLAGGCGLWDEEDGFYYDHLIVDGRSVPLRLRSMVGLVPLIAVLSLEQDHIDRLPGFRKRLDWFLRNRQDLARHISYMDPGTSGEHRHRLLAIPSRERLVRVLRYMLDERELLGPYGIRSLSRAYAERPYVLEANGTQYDVAYEPAESRSGLFGGNSNWRGPVWFPLNHLLIQALYRYHHFYGDDLRVECPTGSGRFATLGEVADLISERLTSLFLPATDGRSPWLGDDRRFHDDPHWRDLVLFHEYFDGDTGRGLGASHQTGWTALVALYLEKVAGPGRMP